MMTTNNLAIRSNATISEMAPRLGVFSVADTSVSDVAQRNLAAPKSFSRKLIDAVAFCANKCAHFAQDCFKTAGIFLERIADLIFYPAQRVYEKKQARVAVEIKEEAEQQRKQVETEKGELHQRNAGMIQRGQIKLQEIAQRRDQRLAARAQADMRSAHERERDRI